MNELEEKMKAFLIAKIKTGEEPTLTFKHVETLGQMISENGFPMISPIIRENVSEQTLTDLLNFRSRL